MNKFSKCEMEDGEIRYVDNEVRKYLKGYDKTDDEIELYKGHLIKKYNLKWLKEQSPEEQKRIIKELDINLAMAQMRNGQVVSGKIAEFDMSNTMEIPLIPNKEKEEMER